MPDLSGCRFNDRHDFTTLSINDQMKIQQFFVCMLLTMVLGIKTLLLKKCVLQLFDVLRKKVDSAFCYVSAIIQGFVSPGKNGKAVKLHHTASRLQQ